MTIYFVAGGLLSTVHVVSAIDTRGATLIVLRTFFAATSRWLDPTLWGLVAAIVAFGLTLAWVPTIASLQFEAM